MEIEGTDYGNCTLGLMSLGGSQASFSQAADLTDTTSIVTNADTAGGTVYWNTNSHAIGTNVLSIGNTGASLGGTTMDCGSTIATFSGGAFFSNPADVINLGTSQWTIGWWGASQGAQINVGTSTVIVTLVVGVFGAPVTQSFYNLEFNYPRFTSALQDNIQVAGNLTLAAGSLAVSGHAIAVQGNVSIAPTATLEAAGQLVELSGTGSQSITSSPTSTIGTLQIDGGVRTVTLANNVTCSGLTIAAGPTILVAAQSTVATSALSLIGTAALPIALQSTISGTAWNLILATNGTQALSFVAAQDSNASGGQTIDDSLTGTNLHNDTNWIFPSGPPVPVFTLAALTLMVAENGGPQTQAGFATVISPLNATVTFQLTSTNAALFSSPPAIDNTGTLTYAPAADAVGTSVVTVRGYTAGNATPSAPQNVSIIIVPPPPVYFIPVPCRTVGINSPPQTDAHYATINSPLNVPVSFQLTAANSALFSVQPAIDGSGTLTFSPAPNQTGTTLVTVLGFSAGNPTPAAAQIFTVHIYAAPTFTIPTASLSVLENAGPTSVAFWITNIATGSGSQVPVTFTVATTVGSLFSVPPAIDGNGTLTFTPAPNQSGTTTVTTQCSISGTTITSPIQTFQISVLFVNQAPSFVHGSNQSVLPTAGPQTVPGWATSISPGPSTESSQTVSFIVEVDHPE